MHCSKLSDLVWSQVSVCVRGIYIQQMLKVALDDGLGYKEHY